jgi:hypothetical protein
MYGERPISYIIAGRVSSIGLLKYLIRAKLITHEPLLEIGMDFA